MFGLAGMDEILQLSHIFEEKDVDIETYKKHIMGILFYALLSLKQEKFINDEFGEENLLFEEAYENEEMKKKLMVKSLHELGYFIKPDDTFRSIINSIRDGTFSLDLLNDKLNNIKNSFYWKHPNKKANVFNMVDWSNPYDNLNTKEQTELTRELVLKISENKYLDSNLTSFIFRLYNEFEHIQHDFHYINSYHINKLLYKLIRCNGKIYDKVYDASCNLNRVNDFLYSTIPTIKVGFEVKKLTCTCDDNYNYSLVNMYPIMHKIEKDLQIEEKNKLNNYKYDLIISTYSGLKETPNASDKNLLKDDTYSDVQNIFSRLNNNGIIIVILPTSYIFNEKSPFIDYMKNNVLDAIIRLPEFNNHNYSILIFKQNSLNTLLIDASYLPNFRIPENSSYENDYDTFFYHPDIRKKFIDIVEIYEKRIEKENFSHIINNQELNNLKSLENYNIINIKEEEDLLDPIKKELKSHRFPAPPWIMYPTIPLGSMGWRMGFGEYYMMMFRDYIDDMELYEKVFPRPITWKLIRKGDNYISPELRDFMKYSGGKYKFFTKDGKPKYNINYNSVIDTLKINDTEFDLKDSSTFRFSTKEFTTLSFIEEEKIFDWGRKGEPLWDEVKYTLCLNANYSKIVSDKKLVDKLLETGNKVLIYFDDSEWGIQIKDGKMVGENLQGLALMEVRDELKKVYKNYDIIDWDISNYI